MGCWLSPYLIPHLATASSPRPRGGEVAGRRPYKSAAKVNKTTNAQYDACLKNILKTVR